MQNTIERTVSSFKAEKSADAVIVTVSSFKAEKSADPVIVEICSIIRSYTQTPFYITIYSEFYTARDTYIVWVSPYPNIVEPIFYEKLARLNTYRRHVYVYGTTNVAIKTMILDTHSCRPSTQTQSISTQQHAK